MIAWLTFSEFVDLGTLVAAIVGLALVAWQIKRVNVQLNLQNFADYTKRYQEIILEFPENINESSFDLTACQDRETVMRHMRAYTDLCYEEWFLRKNFKLQRKIWASWNTGMNTAFSKRAFRDAWRIIKKDTDYGREFVGFLDEKALDS